jgi:hypothetical protein
MADSSLRKDSINLLIIVCAYLIPAMISDFMVPFSLFTQAIPNII